MKKAYTREQYNTFLSESQAILQLLDYTQNEPSYKDVREKLGVPKMHGGYEPILPRIVAISVVESEAGSNLDRGNTTFEGPLQIGKPYAKDVAKMPTANLVRYALQQQAALPENERLPAAKILLDAGYDKSTWKLTSNDYITNHALVGTAGAVEAAVRAHEVTKLPTTEMNAAAIWLPSKLGFTGGTLALDGAYNWADNTKIKDLEFGAGQNKAVPRKNFVANYGKGYDTITADQMYERTVAKFARRAHDGTVAQNLTPELQAAYLTATGLKPTDIESPTTMVAMDKDQIKQMQAILVESGHGKLMGKNPVDGVSGKGTKKAIALYNEATGTDIEALVRDGKGETLLAELKTKNAAVQVAAAPMPANKDETRAVQERLVAAGIDLGRSGLDRNGVDGDLGKKTRQAIEAYNTGRKPGELDIVADIRATAELQKQLAANQTQIASLDPLAGPPSGLVTTVQPISNPTVEPKPVEVAQEPAKPFELPPLATISDPTKRRITNAQALLGIDTPDNHAVFLDKKGLKVDAPSTEVLEALKGDVQKVQTALVATGVKLPAHGADGFVGPETYDGIKQAREKIGSEVPVLAELRKEYDATQLAAKEQPEKLEVKTVTENEPPLRTPTVKVEKVSLVVRH